MCVARKGSRVDASVPPQVSTRLLPIKVLASPGAQIAKLKFHRSTLFGTTDYPTAWARAFCVCTQIISFRCAGIPFGILAVANFIARYISNQVVHIFLDEIERIIHSSVLLPIFSSPLLPYVIQGYHHTLACCAKPAARKD